MSSRDHQSSSSGRKRERSPEDRYSSKSNRRSDKSRDDKDRSREHSSSHSSRHGRDQEHSSRRDRGYERERDQERYRESKKSSRLDSSGDGDKRRSQDKDKESRRHRSSRRSDSEESDDGGSGSGSDTGTEESENESEEDELIKKAKSMIQTISEDDYFTKSAEFRLWLRQAKKKYFEDMKADDTRRYFRKFVRAWNNFELDESYYKGIRSAQLSGKGTTKYQWGFAKKIGREDKDRVESIRDSIDTMTNVKFANEVSRLTGKSTASTMNSASGSGSGNASRRPLGPSLPSSSESAYRRGPLTADQLLEREERDSRSRLQHRAEMKAHRKSKEADLEELVPKATGREAVLEKRRAQTAYHRRERSPDVELPEQDLMGTGDDFKSMLAAEKRRKEMREGRRNGAGASGADIGPSSSSTVGPSRGPAVGSILEAKQQAYKEKEEKQLEAFRQLWAHVLLNFLRTCATAAIAAASQAQRVERFHN
ncbi:hypothetical protein BGX28_010368 [Mortierella sp. GBA30]|nr:hypothetical protein BGX28_010368 [Mortierella sp. GBA30]